MKFRSIIDVLFVLRDQNKSRSLVPKKRNHVSYGSPRCTVPNSTSSSASSRNPEDAGAAEPEDDDGAEDDGVEAKGREAKRAAARWSALFLFRSIQSNRRDIQLV